MKKLLRAAWLLPLLTITALPSFSQVISYVGEEDTLTVTAVRQAYQGIFAPLEIPQAELALNARVLRDAGAIDLNQALDLSASVARQNNFGGLWNSFALRGFVGDENLPSNYLVNGFNAGRGFAGPRDLSGVESVDVLKGPRSALFGRGEPGGTINLVTKRPTFTSAGEIRLSAGSFNTYRADADWTAPLADAFAVRLVGYYEDAGSFRDEIETLRYGASPSVAWRPTENTGLVYELEYSHQEIPFDRGVVAINGELGLIPRSTFLGEPGDGHMDADVVGHQLELQHDFSSNWSALVGFNFRQTSLEGSAHEAELGGSRQRLFVDGENLARFRRYRDYDAKYRVLRGEISGRFDTGGIEHRVITGLDADRFENDQVFLRARGPGLSTDPTLEQQNAINVFNPVYGQYPLPDPGPNTDRIEIQQSIGFFVQDQISLTEQLQVRLGARFDYYDQTLENRRSDTESELSTQKFSPQFGVVYEATDFVSVYAAFGQNFRPLSGSDANGDGFEPNQTTSLEAGAKFSLRDGAIQGTVAVFNVGQENILVVDDPSAFTYAAIGEAESRGFELDVNGQIADGLNLWASYAFVDASTSNAFNDANFGVMIPAGSPLLNIPQHSLSLQLAKDMQVAERDLQFGGGLTYVGDRNGEFHSDFELPAYALARLFAAFNATDFTTVRVDVDNLFDATYYTNSFSALWIQPGMPRSVRASVSVRF